MNLSKEAWIEYAVEFIAKHAEKASTFTANDLWPAGLAEPDNARWLGNAVMRARREGLILQAGKVRSKRGHQIPISVWKAA